MNSVILAICLSEDAHTSTRSELPNLLLINKLRGFFTRGINIGILLSLVNENNRNFS